MKDEAASTGTPSDPQGAAGSSTNGESKPGETSEPKKRASEPSSEKLSNFSRVVPAQLAHISFPAESRFQPVRPVSTRPPKPSTKRKGVPQQTRTPSSMALTPATERTGGGGGGGGILILIDQKPDEEIEFIEEEVAPATAPVEVPTADTTTAAAPSGPHIALDENAPEASPPAAFDVCVFILLRFLLLTSSITLVPIRKLGKTTCISFVDPIKFNVIIMSFLTNIGPGAKF